MKMSEPVLVMNEPGNTGHLSPDLKDGPVEDVWPEPDIAAQ
jgi:hypothetical protein